MKKLLLSATLAFFPLIAHSIEYPSQAEFYSKPENAALYEKAKESGTFSNQSQVYLEGCLKGATTDAEKKQCECGSKLVKDIPAEELFYESYLSYLIYQDRVRAKVVNDPDRVAEIDKFDGSRKGLTKKIEAACSAKK